MNLLSTFNNIESLRIKSIFSTSFFIFLVKFLRKSRIRNELFASEWISRINWEQMNHDSERTKEKRSRTKELLKCVDMRTDESFHSE